MTDTPAPPALLQTAVLLLVFNRPDTTAQVFESIRQAKPQRLYVAADGPHADRKGEAEKVAKVREIATAVDWVCEVKTLFRQENIGCRYGPQTGISWFFEHEEQGIILEDDCLPHPDFFQYCEFCLTEFKENKAVWHINGNNFSAADELYGHAIEFVSLAQAWGWATWADRWNSSEKNVFDVYESALSKYKVWNLSKTAKLKKMQHIHAVTKGLDAWDYQWQVSILNVGGLVVTPSSNLISNLGDGVEATHTKNDSSRIRLPVEGLENYGYSEVKINKRLSEWYELKMGLHGNKRLTVKFLILYFKKSLRYFVKRFLTKIIYSGQSPIVIASTGRSGSTMLTNTISRALIDSRFEWLPRFCKRYLRYLSTDFVSRICHINSASAPVIKTHDLFRKEFSAKAKYIFVFGDPLESARSVAQMAEKHGVIWIEEHIFHLVGDGNPYEIFEKDVLNYEQQIKTWGDAEGVFVVHYDDLWHRTKDLSEFLGIELRLPDRHERVEKALRESFNEGLFQHLWQQGQALREKIL